MPNLTHSCRIPPSRFFANNFANIWQNIWTKIYILKFEQFCIISRKNNRFYIKKMNKKLCSPFDNVHNVYWHGKQHSAVRHVKLQLFQFHRKWTFLVNKINIPWSLFMCNILLDWGHYLHNLVQHNISTRIIYLYQYYPQNSHLIRLFSGGYQIFLKITNKDNTPIRLNIEIFVMQSFKQDHFVSSLCSLSGVPMTPQVENHIFRKEKR